MEVFLNPDVYREFRNAFNETPLFMYNEEYKTCFNLFFLFIYRLESCIEYLNGHAETPKPEEDFLSFVMFSCMVLDAVKHVLKQLDIEKIDKIEFKGESNGKIELYNFDVTLDSKQKRTISITKNDCKLYLMIGDKKVKGQNISVDEAKKRGMEFLNKLGIDNMIETYYQKTENMIVINYAATQDGVILYPDLIKVKISLDDGKVYGVEAAGYIFNHTTRNNLKPSISQEKAKSILNSSLEIISSDMALIPTESNSEILTYEFKGKIDNREFLIYINADNAREEKVLLVIDNKNGVLTM